MRKLNINKCVQNNSVKKFILNTNAIQSEIKKIQSSRSYKKAKDIVYPIPITLYMTKQEMKKYLKKQDLDIIIPINNLFEEKPKKVLYKHIIPEFLFN